MSKNVLDQDNVYMVVHVTLFQYVHFPRCANCFVKSLIHKDVCSGSGTYILSTSIIIDFPPKCFFFNVF